MKRHEPLGGGGRLQRARLLAPAHARLPESKQVRHLLDKWVWGEVSAPEVQRQCEVAYEDQKMLLSHLGQFIDHAHEDLLKLSRI